jgi:hypothetical protein
MPVAGVFIDLNAIKNIALIASENLHHNTAQYHPKPYFSIFFTGVSLVHPS